MEALSGSTKTPFPSAKSVENNTTPGLTKEEFKDPNNIVVTIADKQTPIIIFFGSQSSGKTMTLLRMIRFFEEHGYQVVPDRVFRPEYDKHYATMCDGIRDMAYSNYAPSGNDVISFMLLKVLDPHGRPVCQFLEAPGEHYYNPNDKMREMVFPTYMHQIINAPNRKSWVFFAEYNWGRDQDERNRYAQKILAMQQLMNRDDKVIFLFNKADKHMEMFHDNGTPNITEFFRVIYGQYPHIFDKYTNNGWLKRLLFGRFRFSPVCFSSGAFTPTNDNNKVVWIPSKDHYCRSLWNVIK